MLFKKQSSVTSQLFASCGEINYQLHIFYPQNSITALLVISCLALANAAPSAYQSVFAFQPMQGFGGFNLPFPPMTLDRYAKNLNILNDFDKNSAGPFTDAAGELLPSMDQLLAVSTPLLKELTVATLPKLQEYTEALRQYNKNGGPFPQMPQELAQFGGRGRLFL